MTIHLSDGWTWALAVFGYLALGAVVVSFWRALTMDGGPTCIIWLDNLIALAIFALWPLALALLVLLFAVLLVMVVTGIRD